jgi:hypothetical protein
MTSISKKRPSRKRKPPAHPKPAPESKKASDGRKPMDTPVEDRRRQAKTSESIASHEKLRQLAAQQGVAPIDSIDELRGDFWPEDESTDDFIDWLHDVRREDAPRSLPE